ncbi:PilZ domain-containing protein [Leptospira sp. GIMC2001]|uniref:PilZ domain-containing protein n=1 Tax=Leptospira sp. GIMC2001 TaxID=1513297 RepID=UPI00234B647C|nr:PilZ domain-containing protein [Leptospira sp. GIMC2001]WCL48862.1 DUF1577 domain-containing protein [Leptospira sp. GIMC2001]
MAIGRSDSLQELITLMETMFTETIIGSDINLVKHLFYYLKADGREFDFVYSDKESLAMVDDIFMDSMNLVIPEFEEEGHRRARIRFEIMNILYQFEVIIQDVHGTVVTIKIPHELQSMQLRQNKRLPVDDLFMNFIILFRSLSGGTRAVGKNLYAERRFPFLMKEIRKDKPNLQLINVMLSDYIKTVSKDFEIVIYSQANEPNEDEQFIREILKNSEKSIYIGDCNKLENYFEPLEDESLTNYYNEFIRMEMSTSSEEAIEFFKQKQKKENRQFLVSYIYTPIRIYDEAVGYIKVYATAMDRFSITPAQAIFIHELAEIANYAFTKVAIQVSSYENYTHSTQIIDISMDGLLFETQNRKLFNYLKRHNIIKMNIPLNSEIILMIRGEIVRFIEREDCFHIGVNFFDSAPDDMLHLENYLYEKSMNILSE